MSDCDEEIEMLKDMWEMRMRLQLVPRIGRGHSFHREEVAKHVVDRPLRFTDQVDQVDHVASLISTKVRGCGQHLQ